MVETSDNFVPSTISLDLCRITSLRAAGHLAHLEAANADEAKLPKELANILLNLCVKI